MELIPADITPLWALALILVSFISAAFTAVFSIGGGILMLALMANLLPPAALIPTHGFLQFGNCLSRAWLLREHWRSDVIGLFAAGALVGGLSASMLVVALPKAVLQLVLAVFILYSTWGPKLRAMQVPIRRFPLVGAVATFIIMFIGSTGPFIAAFITPERFGKLSMVGTHASCMAIQHGLKVAVFFVIGFDFLPWLPLLIAMMILGSLGTYAGRFVLRAVSEQTFLWLFKAAMTVIGIRLLLLAGADLF